MSSSAADRLDVIYTSWKDAFDRRADDLKEAVSGEQAKAIVANVSNLEETYLAAAKQALDATGPAVEAAYTQAVATKQAVENAYAQSVALEQRISAVGKLVGDVANLAASAHHSAAT